MLTFTVAVGLLPRTLALVALAGIVSGCAAGSTVTVAPSAVVAPTGAASSNVSVFLQPGGTATLPILGIGSVTTGVGAVQTGTSIQAASQKSATAADGSFSVISTFTTTAPLSVQALSHVVLGIDANSRICVSVISGDATLAGIGRACFEATGMQGVSALAMAQAFHASTFSAGAPLVAQFDVTAKK